MINEEEYRQIVANNLVKYRKLHNLTQAELAQNINYSDKAISKWERGESLPDLYTLNNIAEFYHVTLNDLVEDKDPINKKIDTKKFTHIFIPFLSIAVATIVAVITFIILIIVTPDGPFDNWLIFIYLVPIIGIISTVFTALWFDEIFQAFSVSLINWGIIISIFLTLQRYTNIQSLWLFFILGAAIEVLALLWFLMIYLKKNPKLIKKKKKNEVLEEENE